MPRNYYDEEPITIPPIPPIFSWIFLIAIMMSSINKCAVNNSRINDIFPVKSIEKKSNGEYIGYFIRTDKETLSVSKGELFNIIERGKCYEIQAAGTIIKEIEKLKAVKCKNEVIQKQN